MHNTLHAECKPTDAASLPEIFSELERCHALGGGAQRWGGRLEGGLTGAWVSKLLAGRPTKSLTVRLTGQQTASELPLTPGVTFSLITGDNSMQEMPPMHWGNHGIWGFPNTKGK